MKVKNTLRSTLAVITLLMVSVSVSAESPDQLPVHQKKIQHSSTIESQASKFNQIVQQLNSEIDDSKSGLSSSLEAMEMCDSAHEMSDEVGYSGCLKNAIYRASKNESKISKLYGKASREFAEHSTILVSELEMENARLSEVMNAKESMEQLIQDQDQVVADLIENSEEGGDYTIEQEILADELLQQYQFNLDRVDLLERRQVAVSNVVLSIENQIDVAKMKSHKARTYARQAKFQSTLLDDYLTLYSDYGYVKTVSQQPKIKVKAPQKFQYSQLKSTVRVPELSSKEPVQFYKGESAIDKLRKIYQARKEVSDKKKFDAKKADNKMGEIEAKEGSMPTAKNTITFDETLTSKSDKN